MKKLFFLFSLLTGLGFVSAQTLNYQRVLINNGEHIRPRLLDLGITIDHSHFQNGGIVAEISDDELAILKQNAIIHEILIPNLSKFYQERNASDQSNKTASNGICNYPQVATPSHFHLGSMGGYFTLQEMEAIIDSMALLYPNLVKSKQPISATQSIEGRNIWYVKFSDNPNVDENEPEVLYTSLHHAREGASLSQLIFYMWYLLENYATDPDIQATLNNTELFFVPCVNPDGYVYNQSTNPNGGGMWRRNRRLNADNTYGVDLNRNYGYNWGYNNQGSSPNTSSDTYRGTAAFSEPETQAMQNFCNTRQFKSALNAHTYSNVFIYPWGYIPSYYTPDSLTFVNWGAYLTKDSRFYYGTCDQTLNYITNGSADDWMYGEQTSKPKMYSMTPESGTFNDGFWPVSSRIIDICKTTFTENYNLARLAGSHAATVDEHDKFLSTNGYIKYKIQRLGLGVGAFTLNLSPIGTGLATVGAAKVYPALVMNQSIHDSISYTLSNGLIPGQKIKYALSVNNGLVIRHDTVTKIYGTPIVLLNEGGTSIPINFDTIGSWGQSTTSFVSPPSSITESPGGDYASGDNKRITTKGQLSLQNAVLAHLQFYTRFEIEKTFDEVQIEVSTNNGITYSPLCGKYETSIASSGANYAVYDGKQSDWVKEDIDLSDYLGQSIKLRFNFVADFYDEKDGFYFDDFLVRKIASSGVGLPSDLHFFDDLILSPNPSNGRFTLNNTSQKEIEIVVFNALGKVVSESTKTKALNSELNLEGSPAGIYFIRLKTPEGETTKKLIIEN